MLSCIKPIYVYCIISAGLIHMCVPRDALRLLLSASPQTVVLSIRKMII